MVSSDPENRNFNDPDSIWFEGEDEDEEGNDHFGEPFSSDFSFSTTVIVAVILMILVYCLS